MPRPRTLCVLSPVASDFTPEHTLTLVDLFRHVPIARPSVLGPTSAASSDGWTADADHPFLYRQGSLVVHARNQLVQEGLERTQAEVFVWLDSDMRADAETILAMVQRAARFPNIVFGVGYPARGSDRWIGTGDARDKGDGTSDVPTIGFGLVAMHRSVLDRAIDRHGRFPFREEPGASPDDHVGEDVCFSRDWRALGGQLAILNDATVTHVGRAAWTGNWAEGRLDRRVR
jgi:hypothetical protein